MKVVLMINKWSHWSPNYAARRAILLKGAAQFFVAQLCSSKSDPRKRSECCPIITNIAQLLKTELISDRPTIIKNKFQNQLYKSPNYINFRPTIFFQAQLSPNYYKNRPLFNDRPSI